MAKPSAKGAARKALEQDNFHRLAHAPSRGIGIAILG